MSSDSDSDSNPSDDNEDDVQDDEDEEEEEEDDGEENEEEEEEEEESNYEEERLQFYEDVNEGVFRMLPTSDHDGSNVVMIQHNFDNQDLSAAAPASGRQSLPWNSNFPFSLDIFDEPPSVSDSNGINSHPQFVAEVVRLDTANNRAQRLLRQRRYQLQLANPRHANPPVILQRYLQGVLRGRTTVLHSLFPS
jgi:hypothetical protein